VSKDIKFLVVDDFSTMRRIIKTCSRYRLHPMSRSRRRHDRWAAPGRQSEFDFLITRLNMPGMPGLDLLKAVRAIPRIGTMPVLMLTAESARSKSRKPLKPASTAT